MYYCCQNVIGTVELINAIQLPICVPGGMDFLNEMFHFTCSDLVAHVNLSVVLATYPTELLQPILQIYEDGSHSVRSNFVPLPISYEITIIVTEVSNQYFIKFD
jgi:hypothetical protein